MRLPRAMAVLASLGAIAASVARAQFPLPLPVAPAAPPDPATQFADQCGACHALAPGEQRMGPNLRGIFGRPAGTIAGFAYSPGFAAANWTWDAARLDAWLANPQALIPGTPMLYRQANPDIRRTIIAYLQEQR